MSTKLNLDDLERKARAADDAVEIPWWSPDSAHLDHAGVSAADREHIAANSPPVTLTLIARIRDFEEILPRVADEIEAWVQSESQYDDYTCDPGWKLAEQVRALLAKGVVLP